MKIEIDYDELGFTLQEFHTYLRALSDTGFECYMKGCGNGRVKIIIEKRLVAR